MSSKQPKFQEQQSTQGQIQQTLQQPQQTQSTQQPQTTETKKAADAPRARSASTHIANFALNIAFQTLSFPDLLPKSAVSQQFNKLISQNKYSNQEQRRQYALNKLTNSSTNYPVERIQFDHLSSYRVCEQIRLGKLTVGKALKNSDTSRMRLSPAVNESIAILGFSLEEVRNFSDDHFAYLKQAAENALTEANDDIKVLREKIENQKKSELASKAQSTGDDDEDNKDTKDSKDTKDVKEFKETKDGKESKGDEGKETKEQLDSSNNAASSTLNSPQTSQGSAPQSSTEQTPVSDIIVNPSTTLTILPHTPMELPGAVASLLQATEIKSQAEGLHDLQLRRLKPLADSSISVNRKIYPQLVFNCYENEKELLIAQQRVTAALNNAYEYIRDLLPLQVRGLILGIPLEWVKWPTFSEYHLMHAQRIVQKLQYSPRGPMIAYENAVLLEEFAKTQHFSHSYQFTALDTGWPLEEILKPYFTYNFYRALDSGYRLEEIQGFSDYQLQLLPYTNDLALIRKTKEADLVVQACKQGCDFALVHNLDRKELQHMINLKWKTKEELERLRKLTLSERNGMMIGLSPDIYMTLPMEYTLLLGKELSETPSDSLHMLIKLFSGVYRKLSAEQNNSVTSSLELKENKDSKDSKDSKDNKDRRDTLTSLSLDARPLLRSLELKDSKESEDDQKYKQEALRQQFLKCVAQYQNLQPHQKAYLLHTGKFEDIGIAVKLKSALETKLYCSIKFSSNSPLTPEMLSAPWFTPTHAQHLNKLSFSEMAGSDGKGLTAFQLLAWISHPATLTRDIVTASWFKPPHRDAADMGFSVEQFRGLTPQAARDLCDYGTPLGHASETSQEMMFSAKGSAASLALLSASNISGSALNTGSASSSVTNAAHAKPATS